jgi:hypothetical protein
MTDSRKTEQARTSIKTMVDLVSNKTEELLKELPWQLLSVQVTTTLVLITSEFRRICTRQTKTSKITLFMSKTITSPLVVAELWD